MKLRAWAAFWLLGLIWGSTFLWIKLAVAETPPLMLAALRLLFGFAGLLPVACLERQRLARSLRLFIRLLVLSVLTTAIPFVLVPWGEIRISSGLAAILSGTPPLFALIIAHFWLSDEKITWWRLGGLGLGFTGLVTLMSRDLAPSPSNGGVWGDVAVLTASCSFGVAATFARRYLRGVTPILQATATVSISDAMLWIVIPMAEWPPQFPHTPLTWIALAWLGLVGCSAAYLLYFYLIGVWGATRAATVTYVSPVVGLTLGILFLGEPLTTQVVVGTVLVITGIVVVGRPV